MFIYSFGVSALLFLLLLEQRESSGYVARHEVSVLQHQITLALLVFFDTRHHPSEKLEARCPQEGVAHRKEFAEYLCNAGNSSLVPVVVRQTAEENMQSVLPHPRSPGANFEKQLEEFVSLQVPHSLRSFWHFGVAEWVIHQ